MKLEKFVAIFLLLLLAAYFYSIFYLTGTNYTFYIKPLFVPVFLGYAFLKHGYNFPKSYLIFVFLFYLGQTFMLFCDSSKTVLQLALVFHILFYFALINLSWPLIRETHFKKIFTLLTSIVILLNAFFLCMIVYLIFKATTDSVTNIITVLNAILALLLLMTAVAYLSIDANKKSMLYFFGTISLIFSDVFSALNVYYFNIFQLNLLDLLLHFVGFYLIFLFIIEKSELSEIDY